MELASVSHFPYKGQEEQKPRDYSWELLWTVLPLSTGHSERMCLNPVFIFPAPEWPRAAGHFSYCFWPSFSKRKFASCTQQHSESLEWRLGGLCPACTLLILCVFRNTGILLRLPSALRGWGEVIVRYQWPHFSEGEWASQKQSHFLVKAVVCYHINSWTIEGKVTRPSCSLD